MFASWSSTSIALAIVILGGIILGTKGTPVEPEEFKYVVGIFRLKRNMQSKSYVCAGTIISKYHVLTTGVCMLGYTAKDLVVVGGVRDFFDRNAEIRVVEKLIKHPNLQANDCFGCSLIAKNDIGLIVLQRSMELELIEGSLQQLELPNQLATTKPCTVIIAGQKAPGMQNSWVLRKAEQSLVDLVQCRIPSTPANIVVKPKDPFLQADDQFLCAQDQTAIICRDGLGSPLVNNGYIMGVSWGGQCVSGEAHIYSNVYFHRDWILQETLPYLNGEITSPAVTSGTYNIELTVRL